MGNLCVYCRIVIMALVIVFVPLCNVFAAIAPVELVVVYKSRQVLQLIKRNEVVKTYRCAIGRNLLGRKQRAGDCRTPEGAYVIDHHNRDSRFYKSLHVSYPNTRDIAFAKKLGYSPGGNIMIHGLPKGFEDLAEYHYKRNWTKGCIAVNNAEMDELWSAVPDGNPIEIKP